MGDYAASGGYFVAMGADHILAQPGTLTGSIGVYAGKFATQKLWDNLGVNWERIATAPNAGMWSMVHEFTPSQLAKFRESLDFVYEDFSDKAAADRKLTATEIDQVARGRVWTGEEAVKNKLVDELGGYQEAIAVIRKKLDKASDIPVDLEVWPSPPSSLEQLKALLESDDPFEFISTRLSETYVSQHLPLWLQNIKAQLGSEGLLMMPQVQISD